MRTDDGHLADEELLLVADGEATEALVRHAQTHLAACWQCRERMRTLDDSIASFIRAQREAADPLIPPGDGPRALLRAKLADNAPVLPRRNWRPVFVGFAAACAAGVLLLVTQFRGGDTYAKPRRSLTPGAVAARNREQVCAANPENNRVVPVALQRQVFAEYGIPDAKPQAYEVDYLITPALGGADDIHNLWPQPYSSTVWNARVKDELEDHLRRLVCDGRMDLATAQQEIADDWIAAYRRHFHTDRPVPR